VFHGLATSKAISAFLREQVRDPCDLKARLHTTRSDHDVSDSKPDARSGSGQDVWVNRRHVFKVGEAAKTLATSDQRVQFPNRTYSQRKGRVIPQSRKVTKTCLPSIGFNINVQELKNMSYKEGIIKVIKALNNTTHCCENQEVHFA
jgi:hypothetical protein